MTPDFIASKLILTCHPEHCTTAVAEIEARVAWTEYDTLALNYSLRGDLLRLRVPPLKLSLKADRLWQHTCFEAFVAIEGNTEYCEFNFAPSGEWAAYQFKRYRDRGTTWNGLPAPKITTRNLADGLDLHAVVYLGRLLHSQADVRLRLALCAVIEDKNGTLSYWALRHPPGKPDFHHPDAFALELTIPEPDNVSESTLAKR